MAVPTNAVAISTPFYLALTLLERETAPNGLLSHVASEPLLPVLGRFQECPAQLRVVDLGWSGVERL